MKSECPSQARQEQEGKSGRILITGSKGRIGSVLTQGLAKRFNILELDKNGKANNKNEFVADISDLTALENAFSRMGRIDSIIHLAGNPDENAPWEDILKDNIIGTRNLYHCAQKFGVRRIVFASSTHLFGKYEEYPDKLSGKPISVDALHRPDSHYGISKGFGEDLARYYYDTFGIETISIRIGSVHGDDKPVKLYHLLWLSYRDALQVFEKALTADVEFGAYFAISVRPTIFDMKPTEKDLGFVPQDTKLPELK